jgi:hypothetical protein
MCPERRRALFRHAESSAERVATAPDWGRSADFRAFIGLVPKPHFPFQILA